MLGGTSKATGATGEFMSVKFSKAEMGVWLIEHVILYSSSYSQGLGLIYSSRHADPSSHTPNMVFSFVIH